MPRKTTPATPSQNPANSETLSADEMVTSYQHRAKRKNIPSSGIANQTKLEERPKIRHEYNPHLPPQLRFDAASAAHTDQLPDLLAKLQRGERANQAELEWLAQALRKHEPWLEWSGKREKPWFEVDPVALHMHERVSTQAILKVLKREDLQPSLFANPKLDYEQAVQAYKHDVDWANRMILGDSLQVMASLARREDYAGKVQMIYFDPPYGIKFGSNFQPQLGQRDVKDKAQDLTREPEMVRAYRDTWTLGVHSYLAYLRDRLSMMRELLAPSGSIFVQISDENLHRVRLVMDEVFGAENFIGQIQFTKTSKSSSSLIPVTVDYILWFSKFKDEIKFRPIYRISNSTEDISEEYDYMELPSGEIIVYSERQQMPIRRLKLDDSSSQGESKQGSKSYTFQGVNWFPTPGRHFSQKIPSGMDKLAEAGYLFSKGERIFVKNYHDRAKLSALTINWNDTQLGGFRRTTENIYVVQTASMVIERCMLMTTDPGDLVLDPTCGSGTTAYVAEQWGRRWMTIDTSRVALALARQRLLTAKYPLYKLRLLNPDDLERNPRGAWLRDTDPAPKTFDCKTVPHITLKSIARNTTLDGIFKTHAPLLQAALAVLNTALAAVPPELRARLAAKYADKQRREGKKSLTDADKRRWILPPKQREAAFGGRPYDTVPNDFGGWYEWEVPFDTDPDWPAELQQALRDYRAAWRSKMDAVNACIRANADNEELVDQPYELKNVVRVSGPFTMESVIALEDGPDNQPDAGEALDTFDGDIAATNADAHLDKMLRLLRASGLNFKNNTRVGFNTLAPIQGVSFLHGEGTWRPDGENERRVAVSVGPEVGNLARSQVKAANKAANRRGYDDLVFVAFGFDATAQDAIEEDSSDEMRIHMSLIRPDVMMDDLLKTQPGSQIFTVFSAPRVNYYRNADEDVIVTMEGMDVYDPVSNTLHPSNASGVGAWFVDGDYDGRTFCITQAFFPDKSKWDKLAKALGNTGVIDSSAFDALSGTTSLPMPRPTSKPKGTAWRIAVKVIDARGNEGMRVILIQDK